ncbi:alkene reductase [Polynucleobacter sp. MWH-UH25E]|uniref:alkene reductase n=1 Tax=Polynucleobacter sp. MWH-UH25E TaxID=1855616 RepID=UPI001BFEE3FA|nr:alkene reductase [Polynucleobacter sp. MWH-UH25E]QWD63074.1 alkene reductase [Polynucleobacter sp. MWH-UH25E]
MLFDRYKLGGVELKNRIVMAPMTRSRAVENNTPNELMAKYYSQRASAGLIVTEGVSPSPNGLGYARIPGLFNEAQVAGWKLVTDAVHAKGGKIFVQLMHTGRVSHQDNLPTGAQVVGPSPEICPGEMWVDKTGSMQPHTAPHVLSEIEIKNVVQEYANAAKLAIQAGFDGIELHAANGYLMEQFLNPNVNKRTDGYGANIAGRNRFVLEVADACVKAIGATKVGIRISPQGVFNSTGDFPELEPQFLALSRDLSKLGLVYLHLVDHSAMGAPAVSTELKKKIRQAFAGTYIAVGGFTAQTAETALEAKEADLIAFGRPFISNPDLVEKLKTGAALTDPDMSTFYTPGEKGYTDY